MTTLADLRKNNLREMQGSTSPPAAPPAASPSPPDEPPDQASTTGTAGNAESNPAADAAPPPQPGGKSRPPKMPHSNKATKLPTKVAMKQSSNKASKVDSYLAMRETPLAQLNIRVPMAFHEWLEDRAHARRRAGVTKQSQVIEALERYIRAEEAAAAASGEEEE